MMFNEKIDVCPNGKVCLTQSEYNMISQPHLATVPTTHTNNISTTTPSQNSYTHQRDLRVLNDPLYPALNRSDKGQFESVAIQTAHRNINIPTQSLHNDTYRLVGYLSNEEDKIGSYKLFGRQKDRNIGEFYIVPVNNMYDLKIQLTDDIMKGSDKLRNVDTLPNEIHFESPLLAKTPYLLTELPKGNLGDEYF